MQRTLFYIPPSFFDVADLGVGWLLIGWLVFSLGLIGWLVSRQGWNRDTISYLPVLGLIGLAFWALLPMMQLRSADGTILGLPIRGYGMMVMLGVIAGVGLAAYRAKRMGVDPEIILSLAFFLFLFGIAGARLFYVIQNWPQFVVRDDNGQFQLWLSIKAVLSVTEGGLVVYGSLIGACGAGFVFLRRNKLPILAIADLIAPSLLVGLAIGRIGCLLNGCCYGGVCESSSGFPSIAFPRDVSPELDGMKPAAERENSPPYAHQRRLGLLHGIRIDTNRQSQPVIGFVDDSVVVNMLDNGDKLAVGDVIAKIGRTSVKTVDEAHRALGIVQSGSAVGPQVTISTADGKLVSWSIGKYPAWSKPVHPTQIYSAINAGLLAAFLWFLYPARRNDGDVFAVMLLLKGIGRFLLEAIRDDEPGQFGTSLTISQWLSLVAILAGISLLVYVSTNRIGRQLPLARAA